MYLSLNVEILKKLINLECLNWKSRAKPDDKIQLSMVYNPDAWYNLNTTVVFSVTWFRLIYCYVVSNSEMVFLDLTQLCVVIKLPVIQRWILFFKIGKETN